MVGAAELVHRTNSLVAASRPFTSLIACDVTCRFECSISVSNLRERGV